MAESFLLISTDIQRPRSIAVAPSGDVYIVSGLYGMYKRAGGQGSFTSIWDQYDPETGMDGSYGVCVLPNGNVVVAVKGGRVAVQTAGVGAFVFQPGTAQDWRQIWRNSAGVLWGAVYNDGYILKSTDGGATWVQVASSTGNWFAGCCQGSDVYAALFGGGLYKQTGGVGDFVEIDSETHWLTEISLASDGHMIATDLFGNAIEKLTKDGPWTNIPDADRNGYIGICGDALGGIYACSGDEVYYKAPTGGGTTYTADVSEAISWAESDAVLAFLSSGVTDGVSFVDGLSVSRSMSAGVSEGLTETGGVVGIYKGVFSLSEAKAITDQITSFFSATQGLNEGNTFSDQQVSLFKAIAPLSEGELVSDQSTSFFSATQGVSDVLSIVESSVASGRSIAGLVDSLGLSESDTVQTLFSSAIQETLSEGGSVGNVLRFVQALNDDTALSEFVSSGGAQIYVVDVADTYGLSESTALRLIAVAQLNESGAFTDTLQHTAQFYQALSEANSVLETSSSQLKGVIVLEDTRAIGDSLVASCVVSVGVEDSMSVATPIESGSVFRAQVSDTLGFSDGIGARALLLESIQDQNSVDEYIRSSDTPLIEVFLYDSFHVGEALGVKFKHVRPGVRGVYRGNLVFNRGATLVPGEYVNVRCIVGDHSRVIV